MSDCCSTSTCETRVDRHRCPVNGREYSQVAATTILHHLNQPWCNELKPQRYFFCDDPDCYVVYFGEDNRVIEKAALRTQVGIKSHSDDAPLCYCFGVSRRDAINNPSIRDFVVQQTREKHCACETRNPSGRCCLKDFP